MELRLQADADQSESTIRTEAPPQIAQGFEEWSQNTIDGSVKQPPSNLFTGELYDN